MSSHEKLVDDSVWYSTCKFVEDSVRGLVWDSISDAVLDSVRDSIRESVDNSIWDSVWDAVECFTNASFERVYE